MRFIAFVAFFAVALFSSSSFAGRCYKSPGNLDKNCGCTVLDLEYAEEGSLSNNYDQVALCNAVLPKVEFKNPRIVVEDGFPDALGILVKRGSQKVFVGTYMLPKGPLKNIEYADK